MEEKFKVLAQGGACHERPTLIEAEDLAQQLRRWGWVEIVRHYADDEGPAWEVIREFAAVRER